MFKPKWQGQNSLTLTLNLTHNLIFYADNPNKEKMGKIAESDVIMREDLRKNFPVGGIYGRTWYSYYYILDIIIIVIVPWALTTTSITIILFHNF